MLAAQDLRLVLEERVGDVVCVARRRRGQALAASFTVPRLPQEGGPAPSAEEIAARLGLAAADVGFGAHRPVVYGAGVNYVFAPLASAEALARVDPDVGRWGADGGPAIFCYTSGGDGVDYRARMFASGWGIREDPATGSAAAAFAGVVMRFAPPGDGERTLVIAQGVEMGRPSRIALGLEVERGALVAATIGGPVALVAEGTIDL
jgi:trans-2,3-dihydro-3-hydroxyanthranilate isomerase